jgi:anti-sigma factor RsiW
MTCSEYQTRLSAYVDGELTRWTRWKVRTHVRCCQECGAMLREIEEVDDLLLAVAHETPAPEYLTASVMRRLPAMPPAWRARQTTVRWVAGLTMAGAQAALLYGAYVAGFLSGSGGQSAGLAFFPWAVPTPGSHAAAPVTRRPAGRPAAPAVWSHPNPGTFDGSSFVPPADKKAPASKKRRDKRRAAAFRPQPALVFQGAHR